MTFDLTGATPGVRNVVVTNPDNTTTTLTGGFTVEQGGAAQISVNIIGRDKIRFDTEQTYYTIIQNHGAVDAANVAAFVDQSSVPLSQAMRVANSANVATPGVPSAFLGSVPAFSSITLPLRAIGPPSGSLANCSSVNSGAHIIQPSDSCGAFEAAKASSELYLDFLYGARLVNLISLDGLIVFGVCFNPAIPATATNCDALESIDSMFDSAIKSAESAENGMCVMASLAGCPLNCNDP